MDYDQFSEKDWGLEFQHLEEPEKDIAYYKNLAARYKALAQYKEGIINRLLDKIAAQSEGYQPVVSSGVVKNPPKKP